MNLQDEQDRLDRADNRRLNIQFHLTMIGFILLGLYGLATSKIIPGIG